jgi:hypothetical protein
MATPSSTTALFLTGDSTKEWGYRSTLVILSEANDLRRSASV